MQRILGRGGEVFSQDNAVGAETWPLNCILCLAQELLPTPIHCSATKHERAAGHINWRRQHCVTNRHYLAPHEIRTFTAGLGWGGSWWDWSIHLPVSGQASGVSSSDESTGTSKCGHKSSSTLPALCTEWVHLTFLSTVVIMCTTCFNIHNLQYFTHTVKVT
jgi:hypothetical protein